VDAPPQILTARCRFVARDHPPDGGAGGAGGGDV